MPDRDGAAFVLEDADEYFPRLEKIWADQAYNGGIAEETFEKYGIVIEIVEKLPDQHGFVVVPRRWVVERTFAWLGRYRRLSKDYERRVEYSETWMYMASIGRLLQNLHPDKTQDRPYKRHNKKADIDRITSLVDVE